MMSKINHKSIIHCVPEAFMGHLSYGPFMAVSKLKVPG